MDIRKLETFRAVAKYGSLSRAAGKLGLTFPALSIQLKKLESEIGVKLFDRTSNQLSLNDHGRAFLKETHRVFEALERLSNSVKDPTDGYTGPVSVSLSTDIGRFFAPGLANFIEKNPALNLSIIARRSRESISLVMNGDVDIGVGLFRKVPRGIKKKKICETQFCLVMPHDHPLARRKNLALKDVAPYRVVIPRRSSAARRMIDAALSSNAVDLPNTLEVGRCQAVMDFVERGLGIGLVHSICASVETHETLIQVDMSRHLGTTDVALITRSNFALGSVHQALMQVFVDASTAS
jgi:DNA-binding transcriptional LysR family regulator